VSLVAQEKAPGNPGCVSSTGAPEVSAWINSTLVAPNRPYHASAEREKQLRDAYGKIEIAMPRSDVQKIMGKPDFENVQDLSSAGRRVCIIQWGYIFRKDDTNPISLQDTGIYLSFSSKDKLFWAVEQNLDLKPKGSPAQK
jgi:hypothetical protein